MRSAALALRAKIGAVFDDGDLAAFEHAGSGRHRETHDQLKAIFESENGVLEGLLASCGLDNEIRDMKRDWEKKTNRGFLNRRETRNGKRQVVSCVLSRAMLCQSMALWLLTRADEIDRELGRNKLTVGMVVQADADVNRIADGMQRLYRLRAVLAKTARVVEDYSHFLDLLHHLVDDSPLELYGRRLSADVYIFQLENAIEELLYTRTAAVDVASFLIRSLLELSVRRTIFIPIRGDEKLVVPTSGLDFPKLVNACYEEGLRFTKSREVLLRIWDNLNLVVHLGFRINVATQLHFFAVARHVGPFAPEGKTDDEAKVWLAERRASVIGRLKREGLAEDAPEQPEDMYLNIFYRY